MNTSITTLAGPTRADFEMDRTGGYAYREQPHPTKLIITDHTQPQQFGMVGNE
jgi:hypothetical protein